MVRITEEATAAYEDYIRKVRVCLTSAGAANPEEVIADLREHVDRDLKDAAQPVSREALLKVLDRLGQPHEWIGEEELPWWRKVVLRIRTGPEDWRLAYATFGVLLLGLLFGWFFCDTYTYRRYSRHEFNWEAMALFLAASFVLARATLAACRGEALPPGQKWLVYPSLVVPYAVILLFIVAWAPIAAGAGGFVLSIESLKQLAVNQPAPGYYPSFVRQIQINPDSLDVRAGIFAVWAGTLAAGIWWMALGLLLRFERTRRVTAAIFAPFLRHMSRRWAAIFLIVGSLLVLLSIAAAAAADNWHHVYV